MNEPKLLLLDEPTSGLDSASALMVGNILKNLATKKKITILATIHQPRYSLACMFDKLYFLAKGQEIYFGPSVPHCLQFFADCGYRCPEYDNAADFLLDLVNTTDGTFQQTTHENEKKEAQKSDLPQETRDEVIDKLAKAYLSSSYCKESLKYSLPSELRGEFVFGSIQQDFYITPWYNQIYIGVNAIIVPLLFGSVYWQMDLSQQGALDRTSAISLIVLMNAFFAMDVLILFPTERTIFNREQSAGMYRPLAFYLGRTLSEMPQHTIFGIIMATIAYWMYGLQDDISKYLIFVLLMILELSAGAGLLYLFSALAANLEQSNMLATVCILLFMLFDGNWISIDKVPVLCFFFPKSFKSKNK
ncbi:abc transporter G family protein [Reticulomyxa filosa]|uniref:Abc transporter G family protein n=1 Tax=Reticulomyxa filosa TaxID=46433 RepID=X6NKP7_RETFI|nr:abc transporter G family protein [Reticulomyxa filosa]|eukprot:ETO26865.1 abc transporter G family protein [Reticulomyxa filosa]